jgi:glycerophosphoryl diester phosphodiesterase
VATSAHPAEVVAFVVLPARLAASALQVPHRLGRVTVAGRSVVRRAHAVGVQVHVWTVDDPAEMRRLLDRGVDGLMTDRTDLLKDVLRERGQWPAGSEDR